MKQLILIILFILLYAFAYAQTYNSEYIISEKETTVFNRIVKHQDILFLAGYENNCPEGAVFGVNDNGLLFETYPGPQGGLWTVNDITWNESTNLLIGSAYWDQPYYEDNGMQGLVVFGMNGSGELVFDHYFDIADYPDELLTDWRLGNGITTISDGSFVTTANKNLLWFNSAGDWIDTHYAIADTSLLGIERLDDTTFLAHTRKDVIILNEQGEVSQTISNNGEIYEAYVDEEMAYLITSDHLLVYDINNETTTLNTSIFSHISNPKFISGNESVIVLADNSNYVQLNKSDLSFLSEATFNQPGASIRNILATEDSLYLVGTDYLLTNKSFYKAVSLEKEPNFGANDIALDLIITQDVLHISTTEVEPPPNALYSVSFSPIFYDLSITNLGDSTIHSLSYISEYYAVFHCWTNRIYTHVDDLNILPGETFVLSDSTLLHSVQLYSVPDLPDFLPELYICVLAPNHHFDVDSSNNCDSEASFIVATEELHTISDLKVYPNPVQDLLHLSAFFEKSITELEFSISNLLGQQYFYKSLSINTTTLDEQISVADFPTGVYFLRLSDGEGGELVRRFLVAK